jgi:uncharacterized protein (DUF305 family)
MATHHAQAVDMAFMIRDATTDERLRVLAADIIVTQSAQRGMFMGWLQLWGLTQSSPGPRMAWMAGASPGDHSHMTPDEHATSGEHAGADGHSAVAAAIGSAGAAGLPMMAGMATDAELDALRAARGRDAEVQFLRLMIRHHEGGVLMARALLAQSHHDAVVTLARGIEAGQTGEIETMTAMLAERGADPLPSLLK